MVHFQPPIIPIDRSSKTARTGVLIDRKPEDKSVSELTLPTILEGLSLSLGY